MRKRLLPILTFAVLLAALFSVFAVSPAFAASATSRHVAASATPKIADDFWCRYEVTATAGLNVREGPGTIYVVRYTMPYGTIVVADSSTTYGNGYYWHQLADGYSSDWSVSNWLQRLPGNCFS